MRLYLTPTHTTPMRTKKKYYWKRKINIISGDFDVCLYSCKLIYIIYYCNSTKNKQFELIGSIDIIILFYVRLNMECFQWKQFFAKIGASQILKRWIKSVIFPPISLICIVREKLANKIAFSEMVKLLQQITILFW